MLLCSSSVVVKASDQKIGNKTTYSQQYQGLYYVLLCMFLIQGLMALKPISSIILCNIEWTELCLPRCQSRCQFNMPKFPSKVCCFDISWKQSSTFINRPTITACPAVRHLPLASASAALRLYLFSAWVSFVLPSLFCLCNIWQGSISKNCR